MESTNKIKMLFLTESSQGNKSLPRFMFCVNSKYSSLDLNITCFMIRQMWCMVDQWLALLSHSKKVLGLIPSLGIM